MCFSILPQAVSNHAFGVSMHLICPTGDCSVLRNAETLEVMISGPYPKDVEKRFGKLGCKAHFPISSHLSRPHGKGFCHRTAGATLTLGCGKTKPEMRQTSTFVESISEMVATTLYVCVCDSLHSKLEVGPATFLTGLVFQILTFHEIQMPCQVHVLPGPGSRLERPATESKGLRPQMATSCSLGVSSRLPFSQCPRLFTCHIDGHWKHCNIGMLNMFS